MVNVYAGRGVRVIQVSEASSFEEFFAQVLQASQVTTGRQSAYLMEMPDATVLQSFGDSLTMGEYNAQGKLNGVANFKVVLV